MNPYESTIATKGDRPNRRLSVWFAMVALFSYFAITTFINGLALLAAYIAVPVGASVEVIMLLVTAGVCGQMISLYVDKRHPARPSFLRRCCGAIAFSIAFVAFQPRMLPIVAGIILNMVENTPLAPIMRALFAQPYVVIPTVLFAGTCSLLLELGWQLLVTNINATNGQK